MQSRVKSCIRNNQKSIIMTEDSELEILKMENLAYKRKLQSKMEAFNIINKQLISCQYELDQYKIKERNKQNEKTNVNKINGMYENGTGTNEMDKNNLEIINKRLADENKLLLFDIEDLKQKYFDIKRDLKVIRKNNNQFNSFIDRNNKIMPIQQQSTITCEDHIEQLEILNTKYNQLEKDIEILLDEKQDLIKQRDIYFDKSHRLNCEIKNILNIKDKIDFDSIVMENKYLKQRLEEMNNEKKLWNKTISKYKNMLGNNLHNNSNPGKILSYDQIEKHIKSISNDKESNKNDNLKQICITLLETLNEKNLLLQHQRKTNKILANRLLELEKINHTDKLLEGYTVNDMHSSDDINKEIKVHSSASDDNDKNKKLNNKIKENSSDLFDVNATNNETNGKPRGSLKIKEHLLDSSHENNKTSESMSESCEFQNKNDLVKVSNNLLKNEINIKEKNTALELKEYKIDDDMNNIINKFVKDHFIENGSKESNENDRKAIINEIDHETNNNKHTPISKFNKIIDNEKCNNENLEDKNKVNKQNELNLEANENNEENNIYTKYDERKQYSEEINKNMVKTNEIQNSNENESFNVDKPPNLCIKHGLDVTQHEETNKELGNIQNNEFNTAIENTKSTKKNEILKMNNTNYGDFPNDFEISVKEKHDNLELENKTKEYKANSCDKYNLTDLTILNTENDEVFKNSTISAIENNNVICNSIPKYFSSNSVSSSDFEEMTEEGEGDINNLPNELRQLVLEAIKDIELNEKAIL